MKRLNLGSGFDTKDGWVHVDKLIYGQNIVADALEGLPFKDEEFDFVMMNHMLQMFRYDDLPVVLKEARRVMKDGATLRILTPDIDKAIRAYQSFDVDYFPISDEIEPTLGGKFTRYLFWHGDTRCAFTWQSLQVLLVMNGFEIRHNVKFGECELDSREEESLIVEGIKV